jgi:hypothetical protein
MLSKIRMVLGGLLSILAALFYVRSNRLERKNKKVEAQLERADRNVATVEAMREQDVALMKAQTKAREDNRQAQDERNAKPTNERRTGRFGTADRLRK